MDAKCFWDVLSNIFLQDLLPLPSSVPVDPDLDMLDMSHVTEIRGTLTWAPPRPQVLLNIFGPFHNYFFHPDCSDSPEHSRQENPGSEQSAMDVCGLWYEGRG